MTQQKETRSFEVRAAKGKDFVLEGRAVSYNTVSTSELAPGVREQFAPGAFTKSLASGRGTDLVCLLNHDFKGLPLGRVSNRTLQVSDGPEGLDFSCQLDKTNPAHVAVFASVSRGDICSCSFTFTDPVDVFTQGENCTLRTVTSAELWDVSVVTLPFYGDDATNVAARSAAAVSNSELLAKVLALPEQWAREERIHKANVAVASTRSDTDDSDPDVEEDYTEEMQKAIHERFGSTRSGAHPAHFLVRYDAARCYTRHLDSDTRCRMAYQRDDTDESYTFGECEPDADYSGEIGDRSQIAQDDENLRRRMAIAAGRA
ncbi:MAG: HK97 family phage prohead protease [Terriglobales bacterium]